MRFIINPFPPIVKRFHERVPPPYGEGHKDLTFLLDTTNASAMKLDITCAFTIFRVENRLISPDPVLLPT